MSELRVKIARKLYNYEKDVTEAELIPFDECKSDILPHADEILSAVIEWGDEFCDDHGLVMDKRKRRRACKQCWQSLKEGE